MTRTSAKDSLDPPLLEARGLCKTFSENHQVEVLKDLNFTINSGEMIAIVGASGTGKSTLMHILGTLDRPSSGSLWFKGRDISSLRPGKLARLRNNSIGFIFQFHHLLQEFSAIENIMMPGLIGGLPKSKLRKMAHDLLDQMGLADRGHHKTGELSGGEQQRVAIARALILEPDLLLADEPTGNLDPVTGQMIFDVLVRLNKSRRLSTIMVTHNHALAARMDRCLVLTNGLLQQK